MTTARARLAAVLALTALVLVAVGCSGEDQPEPAFTEVQVEEMIADSIRPTLATNLGEGSTIEVTCDPAEDDADYRCDAALLPGGDRTQAMHVIYRVDCDARCTWTPIG